MRQREDFGWSGRWIALLLVLFPDDFRRDVGEDLLTAFLDQRDEAAGSGRSMPVRALLIATTTVAVSWPIIKAGIMERFVVTPRQKGESDMRGLLFDAKLALRSLRRTPTFAGAAILTVALGIGASSAIFTVVNAVLLRPLPYERPEEIAMVWEIDRRGVSGDPNNEWTVAPANYAEWRERTRTFTDIAAFNYWRPTLSGDGPPERLSGSVVTPNMFEVLGVAPVVGSGFAPEHGRPGNNRVVILGYGCWQRRFGGDRKIIGRSVNLSGSSYTVLGVMPEAYRHPEPKVLAQTQIYRPIAWRDPAGNYGRSLRTVARLRPGVSMEAAGQDMAAIARQLEVEFPSSDEGWGAVVRPVREELFGELRAPLFMLLGGAGFVLLIVCANVANIVLARGHGRRREFAIRTSLGAGRIRLARQLIAESVILTVVGGAVGLVAVQAGMGFLRSVQSHYISSVADVRVDAAVVAFVMALALTTGVIFGLLPVLQSSRADLRSALTENSAGSGVSGGARRVRSGLVVAEVVLATVLAVGAGLMARSFATLITVPTGFEPSRALTFSLVLPDEYEGRERLRAYYDELSARLTALPGVEQVALVSDLPFTTENRFLFVSQKEHPTAAEDFDLVEYRKVGSGYFRALGISLISGRDFQAEDGSVGAEVPVIVNREMAARYWPNWDPLGESFRVGEWREPARVIGVVADILDDGLDGEAEPRFYEPFFHRPLAWTTVAIRSSVDPASLIASLWRETEALDNRVLVTGFQPMDDLVSASVADERIALMLAGAFSLLALMLAAVGIYGVMSYAVGERRREIGIRGALGAQRSDVMRLVLGHSGRLTLLGTLGGLALALPLARLLSAFLFGVRPTDPLALGLAPLLLAAVALVASYVPASRATRIQPVEALRGER